MMLRRLHLAALAIAVMFPLATSAADTAPQPAQRPQAKARQQQIYGSQLMTEQERTEYRNKMRAAKTQAERDQLRTEHHAAMQARAKEKGITLPDSPPAQRRGPGQGRGGGPGSGAGPAKP